jgi:predicted RNA binding protein YcfA (HicA-like mRNA interferase family)
MDSRAIIKRLKEDGWLEAHCVGSHHKFTHPTKNGAVTVIHPQKDYAIGTLKSIYKQAGWEWGQ